MKQEKDIIKLFRFNMLLTSLIIVCLGISVMALEAFATSLLEIMRILMVALVLCLIGAVTALKATERKR